MIEVEIDEEVYLECFRHLIEPNDIDIELLWGGRDSGKSWFLAQYITEQCLSEDYFRFILIKATYNSIKDSQWQTIKDVCIDWNLEQLFKFQIAPLEINCINKNKFLARGMDDPAKLKSIANPSGAWVEEANQISEESFITLLTTLRNQFGKVKLFLSFNPEVDVADYQDFWIYKWFFKDHPYDKSFTDTIGIKLTNDSEIQLKYRATHTTYPDNPFVSKQRIAFHEALKETNYYWYKVFTLGEWGNQENDNPWAFVFDRAKHIAKEELFGDPSQYLYCSFDFNRSPAACVLIQWDGGMNINVIDTIKIMKSGTDAICWQILRDYKNYVYIINGDYSGNTPSSIYQEEITNYTVIKNTMKLAPAQIQVHPNPRLKKNQMLVNKVLYKLNVQICPTKGKPLIFDLEHAKKLADGNLDKGKGNRDDVTKQNDFLDCFRYFINENLQWVLNLE